MLPRIAATATLIGLSLSALAATAAETKPIFKAPIASHEATKSKRFAINADLGRAWVEVEVWHDASETSEVHRVQVPGLSYDPETAQVVFVNERQSVVCANVRETGNFLFRQTRVEPTGDCELSRKYVKVPVDDGFGVDVVEHFEVHFKPVDRVGLVPATTGPQS